MNPRSAYLLGSDILGASFAPGGGQFGGAGATGDIPPQSPSREPTSPEISLLEKIAPELRDLEAGVVYIHQRVNPWLWILSITGAVLGIYQTYAIRRMYGNYSGMKRALW